MRIDSFSVVFNRKNRIMNISNSRGDVFHIIDANNIPAPLPIYTIGTMQRYIEPTVGSMYNIYTSIGSNINIDSYFLGDEYISDTITKLLSGLLYSRVVQSCDPHSDKVSLRDNFIVGRLNNTYELEYLINLLPLLLVFDNKDSLTTPIVVSREGKLKVIHVPEWLIRYSSMFKFEWAYYDKSMKHAFIVYSTITSYLELVIASYLLVADYCYFVAHNGLLIRITRMPIYNKHYAISSARPTRIYVENEMVCSKLAYVNTVHQESLDNIWDMMCSPLSADQELGRAMITSGAWK